MRGDGAGDARDEAAEDERDPLRAASGRCRRRAPPRRPRAPRAACGRDASAAGAPAACAQSDEQSEADPIGRLHAVERRAGERQRRNAGNADRPAGQALPVQDDEADDLADAERRDRDVMAAQPERRQRQQRAESRRNDARPQGSRARPASPGRAPAARTHRRRSPAARHGRARPGPRCRRPASG